ncbi:MAG: ATP-binding protein [Pseudomonadota bacterium]
MINRYLKNSIIKDALLDKKIAFISGPRQVGKTTLGLSLLNNMENHFLWDDDIFKKDWAKSPSNSIIKRNDGPILLDEIHKDRKWKTKLKGIYDKDKNKLSIIVTGSAKPDLYRKSSDSLLGRYIPYSLHPFTVSESDKPIGPDEILKRKKINFPWKDLINLGGFPEPLLGGSENKAKRWSRLRLEKIIYEDVRDLINIQDYNALKVLLQLVPDKVGSLLSINSIKKDMNIAYATTRSWVYMLKDLYYCFFIKPYSKKINRALRAEPKLYLFDIMQIPKEKHWARLENLAALHLLKACQYWTDLAFGEYDLHFIRDKEGKEVDFLITKDGIPWITIECKTKDKEPSKPLIYFSDKLNVNRRYQLVDIDKYKRNYPGLNLMVINYEDFFAGWL